ncbi:PREDICTED: GRAM domain-containing protein 4 isoform X2 [Pseudopodoces humilis]|uniref:GRAM domain-containing protein 4 isoform X2 n=1 Tax=Pseudopodoces humilis TaxID=181119 RepID=UPI0006B6C193|nr:PREDICTED: GRAM domain-containing protein 4 isoform X2 [Pseudopodoces humilis]
MRVCSDFRAGDSNRHVKVKQKSAVLNMLKKLDKIRFRGHKRDEFLDLAESPNASDTECGDEIPVKIPRTSARDNEELRDPAGPGTIIMASGVQDFNRTESDRLNEIKGHLEIALLEKHFLQEELRKLREETNAETLRQELEKERQRRLELEQRVNEVLKARAEEVPAAQQPAKPQAQANGTDKSSHTVSSRLQKWFFDKFGEYVEDFRFQPEENTVETEEPLSARRGWRIQWSIVPEVSEHMEQPKEDLTVSEKFQLVLDVAQKAQNLFGKMADILEKFKNLFMWVQPEITQKLYIALWAAFIASCFLPYRILGLALGLYAGIKFFLIDFIFKRCPRLRAKYDTPYIIWISLLTDPQLKERSNATVSRRLQTTASRSYMGSSAPTGISKDEDTSRFHTTKRGNFHEVFNLSENERPLPVCENGWRCCLINRDRKMPTDYIRNGVLYVTENYLCFESSKSGSSKRNKVIKLSDITDIQKYKVLSVLPGSGMGIAVSTPSTQKPLVFGAMVHRDEAFETIFNQYVKITSASPSSES